MRARKHFQAVSAFADAAPRMPHGSDAIARLFRDANRAKDLEDWYLSYRSSDWAKVEWASAQLGTMFSSKKVPGRALVEHFGEALASQKLTLPMVALLSQRLACWDKPLARTIIAEAMGSVEHPMTRRVLALSALQAGERRQSIQRWLGEFKENFVTREMLADTNFRKVPMKPDFQ